MYMYLLYQRVYIIQILNTAGLVGQNKVETITMGVQMTYVMIQDRQTMKKFHVCIMYDHIDRTWF